MQGPAIFRADADEHWTVASDLGPTVASLRAPRGTSGELSDLAPVGSERWFGLPRVLKQAEVPK